MKMYKCLSDEYHNFKKDIIYPENTLAGTSDKNVRYYAKEYPNDWQLIEETPKTKISIPIPDGFEIDIEKSDLSKALIKFKAIEKEDYEMVAKELFLDKQTFYISSDSEVTKIQTCRHGAHLDPNNSTTAAQLQSILDLNKLCNVAKFLNKEWLPKWKGGCYNYYIYIDRANNNSLFVSAHTQMAKGSIYFKTEALAKKAIKILGEKTIISALTLNH